MKTFLLLLAVAAACVDTPAARCAAVRSPPGPAVATVAVRQDGVPAPAHGSAGLPSQRDVPLPPPTLARGHGLAALLMQRRSLRAFAPAPLTVAQLGQLLWAAQGITAEGLLRTAPSAGALYPLELYVVAGNVQGLRAGIYHYDPRGHRLELVASGDRRRALAAAAVRQAWIAAAPAIVAFAAVGARTAAKYGNRATRYVAIEVGAAAENLFLQADDLGLGTVDVGTFDDAAVARVLGLAGGAVPLLLMPVGRPR